MKELGDNGSTTTRGLPPGTNFSSDKLIHDPELQHLVTSSIPSPPYGGLSLINASAALTVFGSDPIYSTHLLASLAANNPNARFQLPIQIPLGLQLTPTHPHHHLHQRGLYHHLPTAAVPGFAGLPGAALPNATQAQLDILSSWVNEQASKDDRKITSTTSSTPVVTNKNNGSNKSKKNNHVNNKNNKNLNGNVTPTKTPKRSANRNNSSVSKSNRKNKTGRNYNGIVCSENDLAIKKEKYEKETNQMNIESIIQPFILPLEKSPVGVTENHRKTETDESPINMNKTAHITNNISRRENNTSPPINNNNNHSKNQSLTSPGNNSRDKVFTCPTCHRCFGYKHVLQNHERTHTGEKPFECNICMKKFTRDHHLKTHMRLHTGEKPYQCSHCDRQFVQVANLRRHLRVHTGERPYSCELCSSRFSDSNQLKAHNLIHKGEKPYSCVECGGQFRRRHHLAHHKCLEDNNKRLLFHPPSSSSPDTSPPQLTPGNGIENNGSGGSKRERKCRETRRIIRLKEIPVATGSPNPFLPGAVIPEQTQPEDLSMSGSALIRPRNYSGSSSSVTASSPSPRSGISAGSLILRSYCNSNTSSETPDLYSDEDRAADSSTNGKNGSSSDDIL